MKTLIWKELLEHRFQFLILCAFGLGFILLQQYLQNNDSDIIVLALLVISAPLFTAVLAINLFSGEITRGTFPFLSSLPINRKSIWNAKFFFGFLFSSGIYLVFSLLAIGAGINAFEFPFFSLDLPTLTPGIIFAGIPILLYSSGLYISILPSEWKAIIILGGFLTATGFYLAGAVPHLNLPLLVGLISLAFLVSARVAFVRTELLNSEGEARRCIKVGALFLSLAFFTWAGLDTLAENRNSAEIKETYGLQNIGKSNILVFSTTQKSEWWDPIDDEKQDRTFFLNAFSGEVTSLHPRGMGSVFASENGSLVACFKKYTWPGLATPNRLVVFDRNDPDRKWTIDGPLTWDPGMQSEFQETHHLLPGTILWAEFTRSGELAYTKFEDRKGRQIVDFYLFAPQTGSRLIYSWMPESKFIHTVQFDIFRETDQIMVNSPPENFLVNIMDGKTAPLKLPENYFRICDLSNGCIMRRSVISSDTFMPNEATQTTFLRVYPNGTLEELQWIPRGTVFGDRDWMGKPIVRLTEPRPEDPENPKYVYARCDLDSKTFSPIAAFNDCNGSYFIGIDLPRKNMLIQNRSGSDNQVVMLGLENREVTAMKRGMWMKLNWAVGIGEKLFAVEDGSGILRFDAHNQETKRLYSNETGGEK